MKKVELKAVSRATMNWYIECNSKEIVITMKSTVKKKESKENLSRSLGGKSSREASYHTLY